MKKTLLILTGILLLLACNNSKPPAVPPPAVPAESLSNDTIPRSLALDMIKHYPDSNVNHSLDFIIKWTKLEGGSLSRLRNAEVLASKIIMAAYLNDYSDSSLRNQPVMIMQVKYTGHSIDYSYYIITAVCPPPPDCFAVSNVEE